MEKITIIIEVIFLIVFSCYIVYNIRRKFDVEYGSLDNGLTYQIIKDTNKRDYYHLILLPSKGIGQRSRGRSILIGSKIKSYLKWNDIYYFKLKNIELLYWYYNKKKLLLFSGVFLISRNF